MKRKRTLSGIRAALDYKSLNVFGDIVGNFHGRNIPSVDDFNTYLLSYDACDNLKSLSSQNTIMKASDNSTNDKSKRGRKPKNRPGDDTSPEETQVASTPENTMLVAPPPVVIGCIGQFFQRFCEKFPTGTTQYERFVKLVRAYEGKGLNESTFYSCMKDILGDENTSLLDEFVILIRPEESSDTPCFDDPASQEDFPFNVDYKKSKANENPSQLLPQQLQTQQSQQPQQMLEQLSPSACPPARPPLLNEAEVIDLVKISVNEKAKEFFLQAKSSMDPHTYVSFLDIMVELRSLYKASAIEEAIEKLDIAKGILTRVNPRLRVELDRYFPIVNANGAKHNLEHHTFEQSQRQYREWQQAQVARKHMLMEGNNSAFSASNENEKKSEQNHNWWSDITKTKMDPAQQKKDRVKLTTFEKEQIQNAKRVAKENALLKSNGQNGLERESKEDLLDSLSASVTTKTTKKRTSAAANPNKTVTKAASKGAAKAATQASNSNAKSNSKEKGQKQNVKSASKAMKIPPSVVSSVLDEKAVFMQQRQARGPSFVAHNNLSDFGTNQQGEYQNFEDFMQFMQHQQQQQQQPQQNLLPMSTFSSLLPHSGGVGGGHLSSEGPVGNGGLLRGNANNRSTGSSSDSDGTGAASRGGYPFPSSSPGSMLPPPPSLMHPYHLSTTSSSSSADYPQGAGGMPPQFSTYGPPAVAQAPMAGLLNPQHGQGQYTPQFQRPLPSFAGFPGASMLPSHTPSVSQHESQTGSVTLPPPPPASVSRYAASSTPTFTSSAPLLAASNTQPAPVPNRYAASTLSSSQYLASAPLSLSASPLPPPYATATAIANTTTPPPPCQPLVPPFQNASNMYFPPAASDGSGNV